MDAQFLEFICKPFGVREFIFVPMEDAALVPDLGVAARKVESTAVDGIAFAPIDEPMQCFHGMIGIRIGHCGAAVFETPFWGQE